MMARPTRPGPEGKDGEVRGDRPSSSARAVALVRAHATERGVIDDRPARALLTPGWSALLWVLGRRPLRRVGASPTTSFIAARTLFFDGEVIAAIAAGARQVVVVGAGYDTRAWRLDRPDTTWFEVDHPTTQADKRRRAPAGGPIYVPLDLVTGSMADVLPAHGFDPEQRTVFVVEGLTMYVDEPVVRRLLTDAARLGAPGTRLAVSFTISGGGRWRRCRGWSRRRSGACSVDEARRPGPGSSRTASNRS